MIEISNEIPIPKNPRHEILKIAQTFFDEGTENKSGAALKAIELCGIDGFASRESAIDYLRHGLIHNNIQRQQ